MAVDPVPISAVRRAFRTQPRFLQKCLPNTAYNRITSVGPSV